MNYFLAYCGMTNEYIYGWTGNHPLKDYVAEVDKRTRGFGAGMEVIEVTRDTLIAFALHSREHENGHVPNGLFDVVEIKPTLRVVK
ncbi:hypothetical protein ACFPU0_13240 [Pseudomonas sp. GCM10022186]|uniref:hypothetical protein n=1 Tax=Pseudomonas sp. GCM10022186 TaxID=3252650 RepID=UPI00361B0C9F